MIRVREPQLQGTKPREIAAVIGTCDAFLGLVDATRWLAGYPAGTIHD
jgi:hypothetical protein